MLGDIALARSDQDKVSVVFGSTRAYGSSPDIKLLSIMEIACREKIKRGMRTGDMGVCVTAQRRSKRGPVMRRRPARGGVSAIASLV
jgi:hypothetical protein